MAPPTRNTLHVTHKLTYPVSDLYPVAQFQALSAKVSRSKSQNKNKARPQSRPRSSKKTTDTNNNDVTSKPPKPSNKAAKSKGKISPREEIYKSMLREIKNTDKENNMDSLVHKASGILRLQHYHNLEKKRKMLVSWDFDGRRVLTYEDKAGVERTALQRKTNLAQSPKKTLYNSLNEPIFGLESLKTEQFDLSPKQTTATILKRGQAQSPDSSESEEESSSDGEPPASNNNSTAEEDKTRYKMSKVWEHYINTGDASYLWNNSDGILATEDGRSRPQSTYSESTVSELKSQKSYSPTHFGLGQRNTSKTNLHDKISATTIHSEKRVRISQSATKYGNGNSAARYSYSSSIPEEKAERVLHICVVNGSVVSFKDFGFENFTNWFGDEVALENNQQRCQPKFHLELDLSEVENKDIKIRLLEGYKLEVEARRRLPGSQNKSIRLKEVLLLPKGNNPEDLLMFRTDSGKLVVEDNTAVSHQTAKLSAARSASYLKKKQSHKSKSKWKIASSSALVDDWKTSYFRVL